MTKHKKIQVVILGRGESLRALLLQTTDERGAFWQNVTGSVEGEESFLDAAIREVKEETAISDESMDIEWQELDGSYSFVDRWGRDVLEKCYLCLLRKMPTDIRLDSGEHQNYRWEEVKLMQKKSYKYLGNYETFLQATTSTLLSLLLSIFLGTTGMAQESENEKDFLSKEDIEILDALEKVKRPVKLREFEANESRFFGESYTGHEYKNVRYAEIKKGTPVIEVATGKTRYFSQDVMVRVNPKDNYAVTQNIVDRKGRPIYRVDAIYLARLGKEIELEHEPNKFVIHEYKVISTEENDKKYDSSIFFKYQIEYFDRYEEGKKVGEALEEIDSHKYELAVFFRWKFPVNVGLLLASRARTFYLGDWNFYESQEIYAGVGIKFSLGDYWEIPFKMLISYERSLKNEISWANNQAIKLQSNFLEINLTSEIEFWVGDIVPGVAYAREWFSIKSTSQGAFAVNNNYQDSFSIFIGYQLQFSI